MSQPGAQAQPGLPDSPAGLASTGQIVLIGDRRGNLLFWRWPDQPGPLVAAHTNSGPVTAVGQDLASSGGWQPQVSRWEATTTAVRFSQTPFNGRITALCGQGDDLLVAGANRRTAGTRSSAPSAGQARAVTETGNDRVDLESGQIIRLDRQGQPVGQPVAATGQVSALAAGPDWWAFIEGDRPGRLRLWQHDQLSQPIGREVTALTSVEAANGAAAPLVGSAPVSAGKSRSVLAFAGEEGLWLVDCATLQPSLLVHRSADAARILHLVEVGGYLFGATSEGLFRWPDGQLVQPDRSQPVALARHGKALLILWANGHLEERDPASLARRHLAEIPRQ